MPKPILKDNDLVVILKDNINLPSEIDKSIEIKFKKDLDKILFNCIKNK